MNTEEESDTAAHRILHHRTCAEMGLIQMTVSYLKLWHFFISLSYYSCRLAQAGNFEPFSSLKLLRTSFYTLLIGIPDFERTCIINGGFGFQIFYFNYLY